MASCDYDHGLLQASSEQMQTGYLKAAPALNAGKKLRQKKGELSSPKVSLKPLSTGREFWIGFQAALGDVRTFVLFLFRDADWRKYANGFKRHE